MSKLHFPSERLPELSRLLDVALDLPEERRLAFADGLTGTDAELTLHLRRLLDPEAAGAAEHFLDKLPVLDEFETPDPAEDGDGRRFGEVIGPYMLVRELGRGGMGQVWLAARSDGAYQGQVALKLPHAHLMGGESRGRFRRERDILAALKHAHIASFLDAGIDASGQPYLALEWVDGLPITEACAGGRAPLSTRLELISQVASAVHYAHGRLIVHRDIKPSNVMVTAQGRVQLLDFGIAKLLQGDTPAATQLTAEGASLATPDYAAPEQLLLGDITVATDVYAIGVLLFELLTGGRPRAVSSRPSFPHLSADDEAPLASRSVKPGHGAEVGGLGDRALAGALRGDLDAILAKALALDPARRYASVEALASDLERYGKSEPIKARRIGRLAQAGKFLRRHRLGSALAAALLLAIGLGASGMVWQANQTAREARRAAATRDFLIGVFKGGDPRVPRQKPRGETTARELIDLAAARIDHDLREDPATRLELLDLTATIYIYLGEVAKAQEFVALAKAAGEDQLPADDPKRIDLDCFEVWVDLQAGDQIAATRHLRELDQKLRALGLLSSRHRAEYHLAMGDLAQLSGDLESREQNLLQALPLYARTAPGDSGYPATLSNLGELAFGRDELGQALGYFTQALDVLPENGAEFERFRLEGRRGRVFVELGQDAKAEADLVAARQGFARTQGQDHPNAWAATAALARLRCRQGKQAAAEELFGTLPPPLPEESRNLRERHAETQLLHGLCLATVPGREQEATALLREASAVLAGNLEKGADQRRAEAALAELARREKVARPKDRPS